MDVVVVVNDGEGSGGYGTVTEEGGGGKDKGELLNGVKGNLGGGFGEGGGRQIIFMGEHSFGFFV